MKLNYPAIRFISKVKAASTARKQSESTPPPMLSARVMKVLASLVSAALFATALFAVSLAVSQPAAGAINGIWPSRITVPPGQTATSVTIDLSTTFVLPSSWHVHCSVPASTTRFTIVTNDCTLQITPKSGATAGCDTVSRSAQETRHSFTGGTRNFGNGQICLAEAANLTFTAPTDLEVGTNRTQTINALDYASETNDIYTISCGNATAIDTTELSTVTRTTTGTGCIFTVTPKNVQGSASFTVPYTSSGGGTVNGVIPITVGPPSTISFNGPTGLAVAKNQTLTIDASAYATDGSYTISCGDATSIDTTELSTVARGSGANACMFTITPKNVEGAANFTVPYTSSGGHTLNGVINVTVGPDSTLSYNAPTSNLYIQANGSNTINLGSYATDGSYTVSCDTVTESSALISISSQTGCNVVIAAGSSTGTATISVPYTSTGGDTSTETITVEVIPVSNITFNAPTGLKVGTNQTRVINALDYVTETHSSYTFTCGNATSIDTTELDTVTRGSGANACMFTITPKNVQGTASFTIPYTSSGGDTENGVFSIEVGPPSNIVFQAPTGLSVGRNLTLEINALSYISGENSAYNRDLRRRYQHRHHQARIGYPHG